MRNRVSDNIANIVQIYILDHFSVDEVFFEVTLMPSPEGVPMMVIFFWMPGPVLGHKSVGSIAIKEDPSMVTKEGLYDSLKQFFVQMGEARAKTLSAPAPALQRGSQSPAGLLIP